MNIKFFPAAEQELLDAAYEYEKQVRDLGNDFISEMERVADILKELPSLGEKLDRTHRRVPLRRFPYALIFRRDGETIHVVAVAHRRRRPKYWQPRVQDR